jgi:hypothetical protein
MSIAPAIEIKPLTQADRCDRCNAQALVRVVLPAGDLQFCGHHFAKHAPSLRPIAERIDDFSDTLLPSGS